MIKRILFLFMLLFSHLSVSANITDGKFGVNQIFDVQYYWSGNTLNASSFIAPYDMNWNHPTLSTGQYFAFFPSTTNPGSYGLGIYNANGTRASIVHNYGTVQALGPNAIFYIGSGFFGNVITTTQGYSYGSSGQFTNMDTSVTSTDITNYNWASVTPLAAGQTAQPSAPVVTVTGTTTTYTTRNVVSGNTTTVYRTPVTTTTYSDGTSTSTNGTETLYQTRVASNVVTTKVVNGVLTTTTTPVAKVTTSGVTTVESNGVVTTTTQNVLQGLIFKVHDFDAYTYNCGWLGCIKNLLGPYRVPSLTPGNYSTNYTGRTTNGIYVPTNGSFPNMGDGTLVAYTGTITAPITTAHPAGSVYRLYFYSNSDDGFVLDINGQRVINDQSTNQWQSIGGYTASGWIDVVAGQTYNLDAWYWQDVGGYGMRFYWDYGTGRTTVPNSAFTTGRIVETNTIDTTGVVYSNTSLIDMTGSTVSMYPDYVTIGSGTPGEMIFGSYNDFTTEQQTKVDTWTNKTVQDGNRIYIDQVGGTSNTVTMDQDGNKNLINLTLNGTNNNITARQGVQGIGQNEMKLNFEGNNNVVNLNQARNTQGNPVGGNGHYLDATIAGWGTSLTVQQTNNGGVGGHYNETTISGNGNSVLAKQTDNGNKIMFLKVEGALNTIDVTQKGTGQHRLDATLTGDRNSATVLQEGSVQNNATLNLTNAGGQATVTVQQNGGQSVGVTTTCATAGGCAPILVRQGY